MDMASTSNSSGNLSVVIGRKGVQVAKEGPLM